MENSPCLYIALVLIALIIFVAIISTLNKGKKEKNLIAHCKEKKERIESMLSKSGFITASEFQYMDTIHAQDQVSGKYIDGDAINYKKTGAYFSKEFRIDAQNKQIALSDTFKMAIVIIPFKDILECKVVEDNATIMEGGVGRALVGGLLAGGAGAIVGATTRSSKNVVNSLEIQIITDEVSDNLKKMKLITKEIPRDSTTYADATDFAQKVNASIISILKKAQPDQRVAKKNSVSQLKELSEMLDKGHLTKEEFQKEKKKLLEGK